MLLTFRMTLDRIFHKIILCNPGKISNINLGVVVDVMRNNKQFYVLLWPLRSMNIKASIAIKFVETHYTVAPVGFLIGGF